MYTRAPWTQSRAVIVIYEDLLRRSSKSQEDCFENTKEREKKKKGKERGAHCRNGVIKRNHRGELRV